MINSIITVAATISAVLLFAVTSWKFKHERAKDGWLDIVLLTILMVLLHRTISGISMGVILSAVFGVYTLFSPIEFDISKTKGD
ncbi:MAG: hypothetical protein U9R26_07580 [Campylobacterota bacterium]|nr:hypothetical protein [Campylobacterota bacterium]